MREEEEERSREITNSENHRELTERIIGCAMEVHRALGPGLLENVYEECLCYELKLHNIPHDNQVALPVIYKGVALDCGYRMDIVVAETVFVELKTVDVILPVHEAQLMTYLKLSKMRVGLLLNFHTAILKNGIRRRII